NVDIVFSMDDFDISTSGLASHALRFDMSAGRTLVPGELRNSMLTTTGDNAAGVSVSPINAPSVFGLNMDSTSISTGGTNAPGITFGEGGNIDDSIVNFTIENSTIMTTGAQSEAFRVDAPGRGAILSINLENTTFTTTGDQSRGVVLVSPSNASATTTIISGVTVNTSGASDSAAFIQSAGASFDPLTEQSSAYTINVRDSSFATVGTNSPGLLIADLLGNRSVNLVSLADTDISTMGDNSDGVAIGTGRSSGSDLNSTTISFADFSVEVDGENSRGIVIDAFRNGMESSDLSFFLQSNAITTNGDAGHGIEIGGTSGVFQTSLLTFAFLDNAITTNGDGAHGLIIGGLPEFATGDENSVLLALQFDQPLITTGAGSDGVRLGAGWGSAGAASDDRANNIESRFSSVLVADEISATGEGSVAFRTSSLINLFEISETGSITGDAAAILSEGDGGFETFTNAGTIMGDIILGDEDTTLTNTGTITGNIDLGGGANAIFVGANGRLNSLDTILLGDGNAITVEGILSPGDDGPFQTTNIGSDLVLASGSNFIVDIDGMALDPAALGFFLSDRVIVDGDITLQGGALSVASLTPEGDFDRQAQFLILDASGAVTGEFGDILADLPFLDLNLVYNPDNVILNASRQGPVVPFQSLGNTPNQIAVGAAFDQLEMGATGDLDVVIDQLIFASTPQALAAFDTNSGEIYASLLAQTAFEGLTRSREILARARRASTEGWGIWGGLGGSDSTVDGDGNGADVDASAFGFDLGMDYTGPGNGWAVGVAGGSRNGDLEIEDRASEADYDSWYLSGYGRYGTGGQGPTISAALSYTQADDIAVTRGISVAALNRNALGTTDADVFTLGAEARYGVSLSGNWAAGPVGSITLVEADLGTVRETGAQSLNLSSRGSDENQTIFGIGAFVNWQKGMSAFDLSAQYVDGGTNRAEAVLAFEGAPDAPFTIRAPRASNDGLLASVSGQIELGAGWSLGAQVDGFFGNDFDDVTGSAVVSWRF
ncbi:MAG: autotransporter outer membrane beta-barrel domain-containing protein, partial [Pseudomonadota bacterium]